MAEPESGYLDAARACIVDVGWRRTTPTAIARRAGGSRMTIYRRWPDMRTLLSDLLVREWSHLLVDSGVISQTRGTTCEQIARGVAAMASALRDNELFQRIVELDPDLLHPYLFERRGRNQTWMLELLEEHIVTGQSDGSVRAGEPAVLARALLLATYGFVLSGRTMLDDTTDTAVLDHQLEQLTERFLRP